MLELLVYGFIGALIGWNLPQPQFAKDIQAKLTELYHRYFG